VAKAPTLATIIREARERLMLSQTELAQRCGMKQNHISRLESDDMVGTRFSTIARVAAVLGLSLDELSAKLGYAPSVSGRDRMVTPNDRALVLEQLRALSSTLASTQNEISSTVSRLQMPARPRGNDGAKRR
jgi:transcriptional regulator with XRE-family HTH domain